MYRYCCLLLLLLLFTSFPYGRQGGPVPNYEKLYAEAEKLYSAENSSAVTDSIAYRKYLLVINLLTKEKKYNKFLLDAYFKCGIINMTLNEQETALQFFHQAIIAQSAAGNLPDSLLFQPYLFAGSAHYTLNNPDSALYYYNRAELILDRHPLLKEAERLYNKLGVLYYETGDYKRSISYFEKALSLAKQHSTPNIFFIVNYQNNIATALLKTGAYNKALQILIGLLQYHVSESGLFLNIADAYNYLGNYNEALVYLRQITGIDHERFNGMAKAYISLKRYDSAALYLEKAKEVYVNKKRFANKIEYGTTMKYYGDLKLATGKAYEAIEHYQLAITCLYPAFKDTGIAANPSSFLGLQKFYLLFDVLVNKAAAFNTLSLQQPGLQMLQHSLNAYTSALSLAKHIERTYASDDARLFLKQKLNPATQDAVDVALRLYNQTKQPHYMQVAFDFAENNKASVLQAGLQNLQLEAISDLPEQLVVKEKQYKSQIAKLALEVGNTNDSVAFVVLQKKLQESEIALSAVQEKLDADPLYRQLKFQTRSPEIEDIQQNMAGNDEAILSYYYTKKYLLCFYITPQEAGVVSTALGDNFFGSIRNLRNELQAPGSLGQKSMQEAISVLFNQLISPVFDKLKNRQHLVVIPYNEISYVPFEMLSDTVGGLPLLDKFAVSYNYAASLLPGKSNEYPTAYKVLAMAPFTEKNATVALPPLPASADETSSLPGQKITGAAATKQRFALLLPQFPVVHLATHAVVNDTNALGSYIEFFGLKTDPDTMHRLYETEIYNLDMKAAKLVILSACETGAGQMVNGEGVISLSRAFSYAGCKSVITSLWKADDMATAFIVKRLHHYLQEGVAKDIALQKAKLDYINSSEVESRFKTPAYWAHLVLIGDQRPLVRSGINRYYLFAALVAVVAALAFFLKKTGQK